MSEARGVLLSADQYAFGFPATECDGWSTPDFAVRSASIRGAGHRLNRKPRQDSSRVAVHEASGAVVFAVADGGSGATDSHLGAVEACRAAVEQLLHLLSRGLPLDLDWYATTLVAGVVQTDLSGPRVQLFRIGDCGAWLLDRATGAYHALFGTKTSSDSDFVSDAVMPLPYLPESVEEIVEHLTASEVLLVGTDGFGDPLGDGDGQVGALFARHLAVPPTPLRLAHVLDFSCETFDDDRTLVAVWPRAGRPGGAP